MLEVAVFLVLTDGHRSAPADEEFRLNLHREAFSQENGIGARGLITTPELQEHHGLQARFSSTFESLTRNWYAAR